MIRAVPALARCALALVFLGGGCSLEDALHASGDGGTAAGSDDAADTGAEEAARCNGRALRLATYNIESVGGVGSGGYEAARSVLQRIDADVVCVNEIVDGEAVAFGELAAAAGYEYALKAERSPAIGGDLSNGCMARVPMTLVGSWGSDDLSSDPSANDVGRDFLAVRLDATENDAPCRLGVIGLHLKSGQEPIDWFRRAVETERLAQAVARYREQYPDDPMVVMGDFNESLDDPALGTDFEQATAGLPDSYALGGDIVFPLAYQPFSRLTGLGFALTSPGQEDEPDYHNTWRDSVRLDYVFVSDRVQYQAGEVYNACRDDGVDAAPTGDHLDKAGDPLTCATGELASDHFPVVVDVALP